MGLDDGRKVPDCLGRLLPPVFHGIRGKAGKFVRILECHLIEDLLRQDVCVPLCAKETVIVFCIDVNRAALYLLPVRHVPVIAGEIIPVNAEDKDSEDPGQCDLPGAAEKPSKVPVSTEKEPSRAAAKESDIPRSTITARRIDELRESEEIQELLFIAQQYIGHPLNRTELEKILYFYDDLHFPAELIDYLIEYCSNGGHNSIHYIEKVALSWHDEGIRTVEAARQQAKSFNKDYYAIFRALGINNHSPIPAEIRIMDKWLKTYKFPLDVITEACTRTVMSTAKPTLAYADGTLSSWYKKGAASLEDISKIDTEHNKARRESRKAKKTPDEPRKGGFYNFEQRNYDYDSLEKKLLSIGSSDGSTSD